MKKIYLFITSLPFMAFLLITLAFAMAIATFVESSHGTSAARALIYNTHWFEFLWALLAFNLINNIVKYKLYTKKRFTIGIFHVSFLVMILGAALTRYLSFEGMMHIREKESSDYMISSEEYLYAATDGKEKEKTVRFSELSYRQFKAVFNLNGQRIKIRSVGFITGAERKAVPSASGEAVIDFVFSTPQRKGMQSLNLSKGDVLEESGVTIGFENVQETDISFFMNGDELYMTSIISIVGTTMTGQEETEYNPTDTIPVKNMFLYSFGNFRFMIRNFYPSADFKAVKSPVDTKEDAVIVQITDGLREQIVPVFGRSGTVPDTVEVLFGNNQLKLAYGAKRIFLPFRLYLKEFRLERYPGSESPSSFASEVVLIDENEGIERDASIFMNNTLLYKGYKFFQSSYDRDEKGTVLSVNHDLLGTWVTYLGYALLVIGIILSLINKHSYFWNLAGRLKKYSVQAVIALAMICGTSLISSAQSGAAAGIPGIDDRVVKYFGEIWVQGVDGRVEPMSTLSSEIVRKLSRKSSLYGKSPEEVVLGMTVYSDEWRSLPIIRISNKTVAAELGVTGKYISIRQLFDEQGNYRIAEKVRAAYNKAPALRNRVEKEYIYVDERVSISFMVFRGSLFNIFPRDKIDDKWYAPGTDAAEYTGGDSVFIKSGFDRLRISITRQDVKESIRILNAIDNFQNKYGGELLPSPSKKKVEILYNKVNPFERIFPFYLLFGFLLLFILFINIFRLKQLPEFLKRSFFILISLIFLIHTVGLVARWYISGHAPWSNGYESMVYMAWAAMLAGFLFGRRYPMVVGTAAFLAGISLFVAHLSWMNPEITNLVPVLRSYWLTIHVSVITASYGFIGLSAFLGILVLILIIIRKDSNERKVNVFIGQLTTINEMSAIVGLYFLTIGTFFGAIWANESWGRYWGWDPKETWSLITIVIYSFIVHIRLIPSLKGVFNYNMASVLGLGSVIMTYFGVNYYLTGLHSYGQGVAERMNPAVPVTVAVIAGLMIWAYMKDSEYEKNSRT